ncbi:hypothetical protein H7I41_00960 [Mycobacterium manitobense]|uniref:Integral membrane protein n=1 Tax=[Mycobacterium] manitobense TaxID=190147 RepID=A0A9X3BUQ2_9MYCO|nr:hypothetical protein [[Mycobacterium] manitobense]MCV7168482.1 hypothetical protein [[Mycobacterium] manitobense]
MTSGESNAPPTVDRVAAENWFLKKGVPSVLTRRERWRRVWSRSAPALAGVAALQIAVLALTLGTGSPEIHIDTTASTRSWVGIVVLVVTVPAMALTGYAVSRLASDRTRRHAAGASVLVVLAAGLFDGNTNVVDDVVSTALLVGFVVLLTGLGVGSVLAWAIRLTASHLASIATLAARALPVVLLTVLVFFNGAIWGMASTIGRDRMWLIVGFMSLIAVAFLLTGLWERVKPMLAQSETTEASAAGLAGTPLESMPDPPDPPPLRRGERINVLFVVAASQVTQVLAVAVATTLIFLGLALLVLSPPLLDEWTRHNTGNAVILDATIPLPQALVHVLMFLGALTFMYVSARAVGDGEYRTEFLDPLVEDLRTTVTARNRYRSHGD